MGLFDKLFSSGEQDTSLNQQEAFMGILVAIAGADGTISESEWNEMINYILRLKIYESCNGSAMQKMYDKVYKILKRDGAPALAAKSAEALSEDHRLTAFACSVDIATADGVLEQEEKDVISQLAEILQVPEQTAISVIEVMMIKNKA